MGYPKEVYDRAWEALESRRQTAREQIVSRREEIYRSIPEIRRIEQSMAAAAAGVARSIVADPGRAAQRVRELQDTSLSLQRRRSRLLEEGGYPPDYLEEQFFCPHCRDKGYVASRQCECLADLLRQAAFARLGFSSQSGSSTFAAFSLDYYPSQPVDDSGVIPRQRMAQILDVCLRYAGEFTPASESLLLLGQTGLGKTHLSLAVAGAVTEAGYGVLYTPVQKLMDRLESEKFSRSDTREHYAGSVEQVLGCDLLVLDDLGAEFHTQFTISMLYNVINSRLVEGRPTIISTNLELAQIEQKYSQRMVSRLICSYKVLKFYGKDIRFIKKAR